MCRFLIYAGKELLLSDLITEPEHSLINQSYRAREREEPLNGDGFGIGWYSHAITSIPGLFTSVSPAWGNQNLKRLVPTIRSSMIFAHIRAASPDIAVNRLNCHPFLYDRFLWMHNGYIPQFNRIKRKLRSTLCDELYHWIQGTTDSEHCYALLLQRMRDRGDETLEGMREALLWTIQQVEEWRKEEGIKEGITANFALTDGNNMLVTRYASDSTVHAETLYYAQGKHFACHDGACVVVPSSGAPEAIIIASEPITDEKNIWTAVPLNHIITVDANLKMTLDPIV